MESAMQREKKTAAVVEDTVQLVTFQVGSEEYGLDINAIIEVIRPLKITPLPRMPEFIEGVVNLRGLIIPIVDLRKRFALAEIHNEPRKMRMVITKGAIPAGGRRGKELLGLVVDRVKEVLHVPRKEIAPPPGAATGEQADFISGMGKVGERLIIVVDITKILSPQERSALEEAGHAEY
ncbi:MAG TPA: chemotaxis protein CheW [Nitrospirota bacterium]|nr:chemotaxis protein CheW [Nitrospirota bacterium]